MGTIIDKCNCIEKDAFNPIYTIEDNNIENNFNSNISTPMKNKANQSNMEYFIEKETNKIKSTFKIKEGKENNEQVKRIKLIQSIYRAYVYRNKYISLRIKLVNEEMELINKYTEEFSSVNLIKAESYKKDVYNINGWRKYYSKENNNNYDVNESKLLYDYGKVYNTNILIERIGNSQSNPMSLYCGNVNINNQKHGFGILINMNGEKYEGFWRGGLFTGWGKYINKEGDIYIGYFEKNVIKGYIEKYSLNGNLYIGEYKNGMKNGKGHEETQEYTYDGEFINDEKHGSGKLIYKHTKDCYEGEFNKNLITGYGFYIWSNKDTYKGSFLDGKMEGKGIYSWPDGGEYNGEYKDNIKEGYGIFKWANGKIYEGMFKKGKPNGKGKIISGDKSYNVEFQNGKLNKKVSDNEN